MMEPNKVTVNNIDNEKEVMIGNDTNMQKEEQDKVTIIYEEKPNHEEGDCTAKETETNKEQNAECGASNNDASDNNLISPDAVPKLDHSNATTGTSSKISSLSIIALEYEDSDSDTEQDCTVLTTETPKNDSPEIEMEMHSYRVKKDSSSSDDSDSEEDSSSSSSSSSSVTDESDTDDNSHKNSGEKKKRGQEAKDLKNEWDDLPPIEDLQISVPEVLCEPFGQVAWMVEQLVVVEPKAGKPTLNLDTVLFVERGKRALGRIFDVFGQVNEPHYCVRFNTTEHIKESDIKVGMTVYFCPNSEYTSLVFLHELMKNKGIDAVGDDEPPEFSDDEEERLYYENLKKQQNTNKPNNPDVPNKRKRVSASATGWQSNHPWNRSFDNTRGRGYHSRYNGPNRGGMTEHPAWNNFLNHCGQNNYRQPVFGAPYAYPNYGMPYNSYNLPTTIGPPNPRSPHPSSPRYPIGSPQFNQPLMQNSNQRLGRPHTNWPQSSVSEQVTSSWTSLPPPPPPPPPESGTS